MVCCIIVLSLIAESRGAIIYICILGRNGLWAMIRVIVIH